MSQEKRFLSVDDLTNLPAPMWMIEGMFEMNSLVMVAGPPASYKSFLALDWVLCMATGRKWNNRQTMASKVLYCLGEGKASLLKRIEVWAHHHKITDEERRRLVDNFRVTFDVPQLAAKASVDNMLAGLAKEQFEPTVIVIDTFARSFVGLDENSQQDTGLWVEQADRLRQLGYTVIFLHHTKKNTEFGVQYRGSTAIMGAMDTALTMTRVTEGGAGNQLRLQMTKQKDREEAPDLYFTRVVLHPWGGEEGSCVLVPIVKIDDRFTQQYQLEEQMIDELLEDGSIESDAERARMLAENLGISEGAAKTRISRRKKGE